MKLIIDISEGTKEQIIALTNLGESFHPKLQERIVRAIINGTSLDNIFDEIKADIEELIKTYERNYGKDLGMILGLKNSLDIIDERVKEYQK